jgi:hypothetical protein
VKLIRGRPRKTQHQLKKKTHHFTGVEWGGVPT